MFWNLSPARRPGREAPALSNSKTAAAEEAVRRPPLSGTGQGQLGSGVATVAGARTAARAAAGPVRMGRAAPRARPALPHCR